ncbi:hydroxymethylglutaryl-CoA synthase [Lacticaseibacillus brantae]|uniref:3-hydroxy-3-methylglutaryl CoA synthase n=1 Tax=Lacticaseibacillus brantae DSM 23927 TaxID=1423727 RepID=A0A0R2B0Z6_9LACO|nr:hydroxymethylglutaryl-CoA synthase [Lacticaseibacillus brantae]KRM72434.1 3-hydroxy-3-methylglutaryl CoA synthase [Lacticaseibacillus brantae DSM 23927]
MTIGIDQIGLYTPNYFVDMVKLAQARGVDPDKFTIGIGQDQQAVVPSSQDVVTMGANAAQRFMTPEIASTIGLIVLGTETGVDASKAGSLYIQQLLNLNAASRAIEIKEACYGATAGLMLARDFIASHTGQTALVVGADIARYGLASSGEVTQGAGAVAMLVSENPRILTIDAESSYFSEQVMDFWRPVYTDEAIALGKYSTEQYIRFFETTWAAYQEKTGRSLMDFKALTFHLPYTKMGLKALRTALPAVDEAKQAELLAFYQDSTQFSRRIGNIYTGSLYLGLLSLLDLNQQLAAGDRIGLFSYGSGAVAEFFAGNLVPGFRDQLHVDADLAMLDQRQEVTIPEYEAIFNDKVPYDASDYRSNPAYFSGDYVLTGVTGQQRRYQSQR